MSAFHSYLLRTLLVTFLVICLVTPTFSEADNNRKNNRDRDNKVRTNRFLGRLANIPVVSIPARLTPIPRVEFVSISTVGGLVAGELLVRVSVEVNRTTSGSPNDRYIAAAHQVNQVGQVAIIPFATDYSLLNEVPLDRLPAGNYQFRVTNPRTGQMSAFTQTIQVPTPADAPTQQPIKIQVIQPVVPLVPVVPVPVAPIISRIQVQPTNFPGEYQVVIAFNAIRGRSYTAFVGPNKVVGSSSPILVKNLKQEIYRISVADNLTGLRSESTLVAVGTAKFQRPTGFSIAQIDSVEDEEELEDVEDVEAVAEVEEATEVEEEEETEEIEEVEEIEQVEQVSEEEPAAESPKQGKLARLQARVAALLQKLKERFSALRSA